MKGNLHGVLHVGVGVVVMVDVSVGHPAPQSPQYPFMCCPVVVVAVLHHGLENPPAVVQLL